MKILTAVDDDLEPIRVHKDDQQRLVDLINRYVGIVNALGSMLVVAGVPEGVIRKVIEDV